jgi:hypothetical protein
MLPKIVTALSADSRFVAAWLTGSFGRGEAHDDSDLDVQVVTTDEALLARPWQSGGQTTAERLALFSQFGQPGILFEAHSNAPPDGTMTVVFYAITAVCVDWILIPLAQAQRPLPSQLLFAHQAIPIQPPPLPEPEAERHQLLGKEVAYFWMMTAVLVKFIIRDEALLFNLWLNSLYDVLAKVRRLLAGEAWQYRAGANVTLQLTHAAQITAVRQLCQEMLALMPSIQQLGIIVPHNPMAVVEERLALIGGL